MHLVKSKDNRHESKLPFGGLFAETGFAKNEKRVAGEGNGQDQKGKTIQGGTKMPLRETQLFLLLRVGLKDQPSKLDADAVRTGSPVTSLVPALK